MLASAPLRWATALCLAALLALSDAHAVEIELQHVRVSYDGIDERHARAIARVVEAARAIAAVKYGFEIPETIYVDVSTKADRPVRLFNDGVDRFSLSLRSQADLRKPAVSGAYHLY